MKTFAGLGLLPLVFLLLWGFGRRHLWPRVYAGALALLLLALGGALGLRAARNIQEPPQWDFGAIRLSAEVAAQGLNFYEPESYRKVTAERDVPQDLREEVVEVGFQYPPFTMLLFRPLAGVSPQTSVKLWYALHLTALFGGLFLLWRIFAREEGWSGLGLVSALLLLLFGSYSTVGFAQTLFLLLFFWLLAWRSWGEWPSGVWLALAVVVKPVGAALFLPVLLHRHGRVLGAGAATLLGASLASLMAFGGAVWWRYLSFDTARRMPFSLFAEEENQSLLAALLRWPLGGVAPQTMYLALALTLAAATVFFVIRLGKGEWELSAALSIALTLLVYPGSLTSYSVLLLPALLVWLRKRQEIGANFYATALALGAVYAVIGLNYGRYSTFAYLSVWLLIASAALQALRARVKTPLPAVVAPSASWLHGSAKS
jgi:hypothetical protein